MRTAASAGWLELSQRANFAFLTGDLGYSALENLRDAAKEKFINAGIAEQNMVSVAAGLASQGFAPWVYSIAPFAYARPFEQIRNDVCLHSLPVKIVGNGGGFGYGVMGATHHAIEDYGVMLALQGMKVFVPAFSEDVRPIIQKMADLSWPSYLRLGKDEKLQGFSAPAYAPWRKLKNGDRGIIICVGPIVSTVLSRVAVMDQKDRPEVWVVAEMPLEFAPPTEEFLSRLRSTSSVAILEEHVARGGFGQEFATFVLASGILLARFRSFAAEGYKSGCYGSQTFHRIENNLTAECVINWVTE